MRRTFPQRINPGETRLRVLYEDNHLLGVYKPGGVLVQGDSTGDPTLIDLAKAYLKEKYGKPGNVFIGLVHRLDRPVSGVVLYAKTSKAASRLTREFAARAVEKVYFAVVSGAPAREEGQLVAHIERTHRRSRVTGPECERAKEAVLVYRVIARTPGLSLLEIVLKTGRHHQIRIQLSGMGLPVVGDVKYGAPEVLPDKTIALHAGILSVQHPTRDERVRIAAPPPGSHPWSVFRATIDRRFE